MSVVSELGAIATPTGLAPPNIVAETVFVAVSITKMELKPKLATYARVPSGVMPKPWVSGPTPMVAIAALLAVSITETELEKRFVT